MAYKLLQSSSCSQLFVAPGNAGTSAIAKNISINPNNFETIKAFVIEEKVDMVVVGPEDPLVLGIYDFFKEDALLKSIPVIGPSKIGAQLEGSKEFAKEFLIKHKIPTAAYDSFNSETVDNGCLFLETLQPPYVLKADG
jgi:phosphoribosylamine--glycine ligase